MSVKNFRSYSKRFFAFLKGFKLLSTCASFASTNGSFLSRKKSRGVISPQPSVKDYKGKICRWDIGLIKLTETFDTLSCK